MRKRTFGLACLSALALLGVGVVAIAQEAAKQPPPPNGPLRANAQPRRGLTQGQLALTPLPVMKGYLKLTDEQVTKIKPQQEKARTAMREMVPQGQQLTREQLTENIKKFRTTAEQSNKEIEAVLTEEQKKKIPEMMKDISLFNSVGLPPATVPDLKLTEEQRKKFAQLSEERQTKLSTLTREERQTKNREIMLETRKKANELLTDEQKAVVEKWRKENPSPTQPNQPAPTPKP
jgi:Spy/CpxP family protein refolding chaperone